MEVKLPTSPAFIVTLLAAVALLCADSVSRDVDSALDSEASDDAVKIDFTRMNPTMRMTYTYRLAANPKEFAGRVLRVSGTFLTRVDEEDGKRYFGCLMGDPGGCSCCAPGGVLEFMPKDQYVWPTNFPPVESRITVTGRLEMFDVKSPDRSCTIPRLVDADIERASR